MNYTNQWLYNGEVFTGTEEILRKYAAFVYIIRNLTESKSYYGKKRIWFVQHKRKIRRRNRIKLVKESDWRTYWGSNDKLKSDIEKYGEQNFSREILRFCSRLSEANYWELKYQVDNDVLFYPDRFYNSYIGSRISRKQLGIKENDDTSN